VPCGSLTGRTFALWGLAFKPETDDVREAPAVKLTNVLLAKGASVVCHDPEAGASFARAMAGAPPGRVKVVSREYDALDGAEALVVLTEWRSYRVPNFGEIKKRLRPANEGAAVVLDARNIWRPSDVTKAGLRYRGIGVSPEADAR
jgi:UDPglucose 6-dehydrogenase